ncbi:hypothetical protein ABEB36_012064 [Hypothenemus hampei]|uniref:Uncharacterized protein n=1 Tax=Hypothenemus hampei TaxID=57062 RepID=A0ABD1E9Y5_HYPHA
MPGLDKAVSTEDFCAENGMLRLDAILNTLVENKVEALKLESPHSSTILQKFKFHSPKPTMKIENEKNKKKNNMEKNSVPVHRTGSRLKPYKKQVCRQDTSSPDSQGMYPDSEKCASSNCPSQVCSCQRPLSMQASEDYVSIKMNGFGDVETDAMIAEEELRRARKKRRRRRKRRLKKRLALNAHLVDTLTQENEFKSLNDDELPPRAKWTIMATACLLLFMCLLLVGITLRMAPIIDEIGEFKNRSNTIAKMNERMKIVYAR